MISWAEILNRGHIEIKTKMGFKLENLKAVTLEFSQANRVSYTRSELVQIGEHVKHKHVIVRLSGWTCANIRECRINIRNPKRRSRGRGKEREDRQRFNHSALTFVKLQRNFEIVKSLRRENITGLLANIRSINKKPKGLKQIATSIYITHILIK